MTDTKKEQAMVEPPMIELTEHNRLQATERSPDETNRLTHSPTKVFRHGSKVGLTTDLDIPNYEEMKKAVSKAHARTLAKKPYRSGDVCWRSPVGWHKFTDTTRKSEIDKFGVGVVHYFRFIKYLGVFFFIASILSIPSLYFNIQAAQDATGEEISANFKDVLYMTSLGSLQRGVSQCSTVKLGEDEPIKFSCQKGTLGKFENVKYGRVIEPLPITCELFTENSYDNECNYLDEADSVFKQQYESQCEGKTSCSITPDRTFFDFTRNPDACNQYDNTATAEDVLKPVNFHVLCQNIDMKLAGGRLVGKQTVGWIVVSIDCGISLLYFIFLLFLKNFEKKTVEHVLGNADSVDSCTIEVRSLPRMTIAKLRAKLWDHFSKITVNNKVFEIPVVDVQVAESNSLLRLNSQYGTIREKKVRSYRNFYNKWRNQSEGELTEFDYDDLMKISVAGGKKSQKEFKKITKMKESQDKIRSKIHRAKNEKKAHVLSAFVTFEDKATRDTIFAHFQRSPFTSCCFSICCCGYKNDPNVFGKKYLSVQDAPEPSNIKWNNMDAGNLEKTLRRLVSWVITIALWAGSFALMAMVRNKQAELAKVVRPYKDCSGLENITPQEVREDNEKGYDSLGLAECYCRASVDRAFQDVCSEWTINRFISESLPYIIVVGVIIINFILQLIFRMLSAFERHRSITTESVSRILKIFVAQALNTGIIILIVNARFSDTTPVPSLIDGLFADVTTQWYLDVATTLLLTMIINIISLPFINLANWILRSIIRCWDRGCTTKEGKTKKKSQKAWIALYTGPEFLIELRYARILTVVFVCLFYSANVPLLYANAFVNLFIIYWLDKADLLQFCQVPKNLDRKLHTMVRKTLFLAILLHLGNAIWAYGKLEVFGDTETLSAASEILSEITDGKAPGIFARLIERAIQNQNLSLTCLFLLILLLLLLRIFFQGTLIKLLQCCKRKKTQKKNVDSYKARTSYFARIKNEDLELEEKYLDKEIQAIDDEALRVHLAKRLDRVRVELKLRAGSEESTNDKFTGVFSYSLGHHPMYKRFFNAKGIVEAVSP